MDIDDYESIDHEESDDYGSSEYDNSEDYDSSESNSERSYESPYESGMKKRRPIIGAIIDNDIETVRELIRSNKNNINEIGEKGRYEGVPIKYAIMYKRKEITELLIDDENFNIHIWIKIVKGNILHGLVDRDAFDMEFTLKIISKILSKLNHDEKKIVINNMGDNNFQTVLVTAINCQQDIRILDLLLLNGANPNIPNFYGNTPLMECITCYRARPFDLCQLLLNYGADPNLQQYGFGYTALMFACRNTQNFQIIELLIEISDINIQIKNGDTLLMESVLREASERNPKELNFFGIRKEGNIKIIAMILQHNPDIDIVNNCGKTVFDLIDEKYTSEKVKSMLFEYRRLKITENMMMSSLLNPYNKYDENIDNFPNVASLISEFLDGKSKKRKSKSKSVKKHSRKRKSVKKHSRKSVKKHSRKRKSANL